MLRVDSRSSDSDASHRSAGSAASDRNSGPKVCNKCHQKIKNVADHTEPYVRSKEDGHTCYYHTACFTCSTCRNSLAQNAYFSSHMGNQCFDCKLVEKRASARTGQMDPPGTRTTRMIPWQRILMTKNFEGACRACGKERQNREHFFTTGDGAQYHKRCLVCHGCKQPHRKWFHTVDGKRYCKPCAEVEDAKHNDYECEVCQQKIRIGEHGLILGDGSHVHEACFNCDGCRQRLDGRYFRTPDGTFCSICHGTAGQAQAQPKEDDKRCADCGNPITHREKFRTSGGMYYHSKCGSRMSRVTTSSSCTDNQTRQGGNSSGYSVLNAMTNTATYRSHGGSGSGDNHNLRPQSGYAATHTSSQRSSASTSDSHNMRPEGGYAMASAPSGRSHASTGEPEGGYSMRTCSRSRTIGPNGAVTESSTTVQIRVTGANGGSIPEDMEDFTRLHDALTHQPLLGMNLSSGFEFPRMPDFRH